MKPEFLFRNTFPGLSLYTRTWDCWMYTYLEDMVGSPRAMSSCLGALKFGTNQGWLMRIILNTIKAAQEVG